MKKLVVIAATAGLSALSLTTVFAQETKQADPSTAATMQFDKSTWVKTVASSNLFEIQSSKLALKNATSKEVKEFAQQMINDHTKATKQLRRIVKKEGDAAPPKKLAPKHAAALQQLKNVEGKDFDAAYIQLQQDAHVEAVSLFEAYAANPDDNALGAFAKETLPTLKMHLDDVKMLSSK